MPTYKFLINTQCCTHYKTKTYSMGFPVVGEHLIKIFPLLKCNNCGDISLGGGKITGALFKIFMYFWQGGAIFTPEEVELDVSYIIVPVECTIKS